MPRGSRRRGDYSSRTVKRGRGRGRGKRNEACSSPSSASTLSTSSVPSPDLSEGSSQSSQEGSRSKRGRRSGTRSSGIGRSRTRLRNGRGRGRIVEHRSSSPSDSSHMSFSENTPRSSPHRQSSRGRLRKGISPRISSQRGGRNVGNRSQSGEMGRTHSESSSVSAPNSPSRLSHKSSSSSEQDQSSQRKKKKREAYCSLPNDELNHLVQDCVYYLLIADQKKHPIKRNDIKKHVLKQHGRAFSKVIAEAKKILNQVYGINLVELEGFKNHYILINSLEYPDSLSRDFRSDIEYAKIGLTGIILTLIFMSRNVLSESLLWEALKKLGINSESIVPHSLFGDVKKFVTQELVHQMYLQYTKVEGSDPPEYEFRWGPRAKLETSKNDMLDFVCHMYEMEKEQWTAQYQEVLQSTENLGI